MKITLKNVASYKQPVTVEANKDINLFYGLNGAGKTILSNFLYYLQSDDPKKNEFQECGLEGIDIDKEKILVYNQNFIQENFLSQDELKKDGLKGIFTLSKENKAAEEEIKDLDEKKENLLAERENKEQEKKELEQRKRDELNDIQNVVWKIKTDYSGPDRNLDFCLHGLKSSKEILFNYIKEIPTTEITKRADHLEDEAKRVIGKDAKPYEEIALIRLDVEAIENNGVFSEKIVGNVDSPLAELITKLANQEWVEAGRRYLPSEPVEDKEQCPFCQEETITQSFIQQVEIYFDESYQQKIQRIGHLQNQYESQIEKLSIDDDLDHPLIQERRDAFENHFNKLKQSLRDNLSKIGAKLEQPKQEIELSRTQNKLKDLNDFIAGVNQEVQTHNQNIDNKKQTKERIKNEFWQIMRNQYDEQILQYGERDKKLNNKLREVIREIESINSEIGGCEKKIRDQQKRTVNIYEAIQNINSKLKNLGIVGFSIEKHEREEHEGNLYKIVREGSDEQQFPTLSEGEKMIISFLYFTEQCKGKASVDDTATEANKIIVIDDPISSLSHTHIFNIGILIKNDFFNKEYKQVLVLTHSLYFFNELKKLVKIENRKNKNREKSMKFFHLTKDNENKTRIDDMKENKILSEYQSYWQVIKDYRQNKMGMNYFLLPNCMRNILEYFFGIINKSNMSKELEKLGPEFEAFSRYMNRESHSDTANITVIKEMDPDMLMKTFEEVFIKSGHKIHYNKYMNDEQP